MFRYGDQNMMMQSLLFVISGVLIGLSVSLLIFNFATKKQLKQTKLKGMANMYNELLLKQRNKKYRYSKDAQAAVKAVNIANILK